MRKPSLLPLLLSALFCSALSAQTQPSPDQPPLPNGPGKETVQAVCSKCHTLDRVVAAGFTRDGWQLMVNQMISNGATLTPDQIPEVVDYLARNFPEKPMPAAVILPGKVEATIKEWTVPTPGSRPHDPLLRAGRLRLVHGQCRESSRPLRSQDRRIQGISPEHAALRSARPRCRQGRQHLVHRESGGLRRQARSENRQHHRIQDARSGRERSAHARLRSERYSVVHPAGRRHGRPARSRRPAK